MSKSENHSRAGRLSIFTRLAPGAAKFGVTAGMLLSGLLHGAPAADAQDVGNEDLYHQGNSVNSSGWDIYGDFQESEEEEKAAQLKAQQEREQALREEAAEKRRRRQDFFATGVDVYDESLARTVREEQEVKSLE
ncbi:MAG: hypothetical protein KDD69_03960 [Bdellovibrionales bacterium]|nr:hypothetical protein [Bdellovibrionales bacterium]